MKCFWCKKEAEPGYRCCAYHREYSRQAQQKRTARHLAAGLCPSCGKRRPVRGKRSCAVCLQRFRDHQKNLRERRRLAGLCVICNVPVAEGGAALCAACRDRYNASQRKRLREQLGATRPCCWCRLPIPRGLEKLCPECRKLKPERDSRQSWARQRRNIDAGLCACGQERAPHSKSRCPRCLERSREYQRSKYAREHP